METANTPTNLDPQALQNRLLTLHQARLELVQEISLQTLLERITELTREQVGARYAALGVVDANGELTRFITIGMSQEEIARMKHPPLGLGLIGALMHSAQPIRIADIQNDPRRVGFPTHHPVMRSFLGVPIRQGERPLGQIYLTDKENGAEFTAEDQMVIEMLAAYASVAITNARLYESLIARDQALIRRNENLMLLNEIAVTLATASDIEQILGQAVQQVMDYLHLEVGEVYLRQEESNRFSLSLHLGKHTAHLWKSPQFLLGEGTPGQTARDGQHRLLEVAKNKAELNPEIWDCLNYVASFPLSGRNGVLGVLCVATCHLRPPDELEMQFLGNIGSWLGTEVDNARLSLQGRRLAILEERERIGMDLHDGIIQSIYAVGLTLEHARLLMSDDPSSARRRIEQAISDLNSTIRDIRTYILDLRPRQLHDENLMDGLQRLVNEFHTNSLIEAELQGPKDGFPGMSDAQAVALFHICQEALANIAKHARATHVEVTVWKTSTRVLLEVSDNGRGFDPEKVTLTLGHGLSNMQTRARNVGGEVELSSEPGQGTSILAWVPYQEA